MADISKETLALLGKGHVWRHTQTGRDSTVLYLANTELGPKAAKRNPPTVTYLTDDGKVVSKLVAEYVESREYITINTYIERLLEAALQPEPEDATGPDLGSVLNEDEPSMDGESESESELDIELKGETGYEPEEPAESQLRAVFRSSSTQEFPVIDPITMANSILQYEQDPDIDMKNPLNSRVRHKLVMSLNGFTLDQLNSVFTPSEGSAYYPMFTVNGIDVDWVAYHGAYPVVSPDGVFASVIFTTYLGGNFEEEVIESKAAEPVAEAYPVTEPAPQMTEESIVPEQPAVTVRVETKYEQPEPDNTVLAALSTGAVRTAEPETEDDPVLKIIDDDDVVVAGQGNSPQDDQRDDTEALFGQMTNVAKPPVQPQGMSPFQFQPQVVRKP